MSNDTQTLHEAITPDEHQHVRFHDKCALIARNVRERPTISTKSYSVSLPLRWMHPHSPVINFDHQDPNLPCASARTASLTVKLPSISTRRATVSSSNPSCSEFPAMKSCLRVGTLNSPSRTHHKARRPSLASESYACATSPTLPPLIEDLPASFLNSPTIAPSLPRPENEKSSNNSLSSFNPRKASPPLAVETSMVSPLLSPMSSTSPMASPSTGANISISGLGYFTRHRQRSSSLSTEGSATTTTTTAPLVSSSPTTTTTSLSKSLSRTPSKSDTPAKSGTKTIPLRPCCSSCIRTLARHSEALSKSITKEAFEANWTPRARMKKQADDKEAEAIRRSARISEGGAPVRDTDANAMVDGDGGVLREAGEGARGTRADTTVGSWLSETMRVMGLDAQDELPAFVPVLREPLSPASLKRSKELRASFSEAGAKTEGDVMLRKPRSVIKADEVDLMRANGGGGVFDESEDEEQDEIEGEDEDVDGERVERSSPPLIARCPTPPLVMGLSPPTPQSEDDDEGPTSHSLFRILANPVLPTPTTTYPRVETHNHHIARSMSLPSSPSPPSKLLREPLSLFPPTSPSSSSSSSSSVKNPSASVSPPSSSAHPSSFKLVPQTMGVRSQSSTSREQLGRSTNLGSASPGNTPASKASATNIFAAIVRMGSVV